MDNRQKNRRVSLGLIGVVSAALLAAGGGAAWWTFKSLTTSSNTPQPIPTLSPVTTQSSAQEKVVQVYWLNNSSQDVSLMAAPVTLEVNSETSSEILTTALKLLLAGPNEENYTTTIPKDTELLNLTVEKDGIHLNLSQEFTHGGGSAEMTARLAQILYTSTALDPSQAVWIDVEGEPLEFLGGEGIILDQPMTRKDFEENFTLGG